MACRPGATVKALCSETLGLCSLAATWHLPTSATCCHLAHVLKQHILPKVSMVGRHTVYAGLSKQRVLPDVWAGRAACVGAVTPTALVVLTESLSEGKSVVRKHV